MVILWHGGIESFLETAVRSADQPYGACQKARVPATLVVSVPAPNSTIRFPTISSSAKTDSLRKTEATVASATQGP